MPFRLLKAAALLGAAGVASYSAYRLTRGERKDDAPDPYDSQPVRRLNQLVESKRKRPGNHTPNR